MFLHHSVNLLNHPSFILNDIKPWPNINSAIPTLSKSSINYIYYLGYLLDKHGDCSINLGLKYLITSWVPVKEPEFENLSRNKSSISTDKILGIY